MQHRAHNLLTHSVSARLLASRLTIQIIEIPPDHAIEWHGLGRVIAANETLRSSLCLSLRSFADCRVPQALAGAIEADGISQETESEANDEDRL